MKGDRIIAILLFLASAALIAVGAVFYLGKDRRAPEITFSASELVYGEDTREEELLGAVSAYDDRDGDVTERVVVEKIVVSDDEGTAVVYYAASDASGNVAKASRRFAAEAAGVKETETGGDAPTAEAAAADAGVLAGEIPNGEREDAPGLTETAEGAEKNGAEEAEDTAADGAGEEVPEEGVIPEEDDTAQAKQDVGEEKEETTQALTGEEREAAEQEEKEAAEKARKEAEEKAKAEAEAAQRAAEEAAARAAEEAEKPHITLKKTSVTVPAGTGPAWVEVIGSMTDNKDSYEKLFQNLSVSKYDRNTPGTYAVSVTTTDSDKNVSDPVTLTIIVQ